MSKPKKIIKETFELAPDQGASFLAGLKKEGYLLKEVNRKGTKATVTFVLNSADL